MSGEPSFNSGIIEKHLGALEGIARGYAAGSAENEAIKTAAEALLYLFHAETREAFIKFMSEMDRPLSEAKRLYLRSIGIDPDTFEAVEGS